MKEKNRGITLVALVVTIVVLLILAGITITYVMGDNSVFKQATQSKLYTELAKIEEQAGTIYSSKLLQKVKDNLKEKPTMQEVVGELRNEGYTIVQIEVNKNKVTGISLDKERITLEYGKNKTIQVTLLGNIDPYAYYVKVDDKYYGMHFNSGAVSIDRTESDISSLGDNTVSELKINSEDETIATATVDKDTNVITVTAKNVAGTVKITVIYGEYTKICNIKVVEALATEISLNETSYVVTGGNSWTNDLQLQATVIPANADQEVSWRSSDESIATVDSNGIVKAVQKGKGGDIKVIATTKDGTNLSAECEIRVEMFSALKTTRTEYIDGEGNKAIIPQTFAVGTSDNVNKVTGGLVIQDNEGNQFVWIPVGEFKGKNGKADNIVLGRYTFDITDGTPTLEQDADNYTEIVNIRDSKIGDYDIRELVDSSEDIVAKDLGSFVTKTKAIGGYYFGRYEASKGKDGKTKTQYDKNIWTGVTQPNAVLWAREMYNNDLVESDLINSYSWDTAILFIQKYSGESNYANKTDLRNNLLNAGRARDMVCNIHDMSSNCAERSTEYCMNGPCIIRGGIYNNTSVSNNYTSGRGNTTTKNYKSYLSFRPILYLK